MHLGGAAQAVDSRTIHKIAQRTNHFVIRMSGTLTQPGKRVKKTCSSFGCFTRQKDPIFMPSMVNEVMDSLNAIIPNLFPN